MCLGRLIVIMAQGAKKNSTAAGSGLSPRPGIDWCHDMEIGLPGMSGY